MGLVQFTPGNEIAFFEIAATLIPILLFGGVITERFQPPPTGKWRFLHVFIAPYFPLFGSLALFAEAIAIGTVVMGDGTTYARVFVALVLVLAMTAVVLTISSPWLAVFQEQGGQSYRWIARLSVGVVLVSAVGAFIVLVNGVHSADRTEREAEVAKEASVNLGEQDAVGREIESISRELDRITQRREVALFRKDFILYRSLTRQIRHLEQLLSLKFRQQERLMLENENLIREWLGEPPLKNRRMADKD